MLVEVPDHRSGSTRLRSVVNQVPGLQGIQDDRARSHGVSEMMTCAFLGVEVFAPATSLGLAGSGSFAGILSNTSFASHGVYATGDCSYNSVNLITRSGPKYFNPDHTSDAYFAKPYLNQSSGGTGSNRFTIDGVLQS